MARVELIMPKMGESIMEATILKWVKKEGDSVGLDETILEMATDKVDIAIDRIEEKLRATGEREVPTAKVGELVMRELARLDKVAYIRFASVYKSFDTPDDFREAVLKVKKPRRK